MLQVALSVSKPRRSFVYAAVSTVGSVLGGVLGWAIGWLAWVAIFTAAFTPIPFKVFTIAAGVFGIPLPVLIGASLVGRASSSSLTRDATSDGAGAMPWSRQPRSCRSAAS